jgi:hypothetical protein
VHAILLPSDAASQWRGRIQVCELLRRCDLVPARPFGQNSSEQAWRSRANKRRDGAAPAQLFIAGLVQRLRDVVRCSASSTKASGLKGSIATMSS